VLTCISEKIAYFIEQINFNKLSINVTELSKKCVLDALGNALLGFNTPWASAILNLAKEMRGRQEATVVNFVERMPSPNAAFANGTMAHSFDFDDAGEHGGHPGAVIIPTALSVGEKVGANGRDFISSIVIGYEIKNRLLRAVDPLPEKNHYVRGFHPTATCGTFASAAVAGRLLTLTKEQVCNSFGIAGSYAAGSLEWLCDGSMTKRFHPGKAAHDGIVSAILAQNGLTGPKSIFEGKYGFLRAYSDVTEPERLTDQLGSSPFEIEKTSFKRHAACLAAHAALDGILDIMHENNIEVNDIENVVIGIRKSHYRLIADPLSRKYAPQTVLEAQMSLPYCAALVLSYGRAVLPNDFNEEKIRDPGLLRLAKKIKPILDPRLDEKEWYDKRPANVEIKTVDGQKIQKKVPFPRGDPRNPLTLAQLEEKFTTLAVPVLGDEKASELIRIVDKLDKIDDIKELGDILRPNK